MGALALTNILKGSMDATSATLNGTLTPEQAHSFVDAIKNNSDFLKKITTVKMKKLTKQLDGWDVAKGILVRVPSGDKPTDAQRKKLTPIGATLNAKPMQLFARLLQDALEDNADNPKFEQEVFASFVKAFGNDVAYLGFVGEKDDYANKDFKNLNVGWVQLAKDASDTKKITYAKADKMVDRLSAVAQNIHEDVFGECVILISSADYLAYQQELGKDTNTASVVINGGAKEILGVPLEVSPLMEKGTYLATPLKNLVFGMGINIRRNRWYDNEERAMKYVFDVFADYEIVAKKWATISTLKA